MRLRCLGQSLVTTLTSADLWPEVVPGLPGLSRLSLSRGAGLQIGLRNRFSTCDFPHFPGRERTRSGLSVHPVNVGRLRVERAGTDGFTDDHCSLALRRCYLRMFLKPAASR